MLSWVEIYLGLAILLFVGAFIRGGGHLLSVAGELSIGGLLLAVSGLVIAHAVIQDRQDRIKEENHNYMLAYLEGLRS